MPKRYRREEDSPEEPFKKQAKQNEWSLSQALSVPGRLIDRSAGAEENSAQPGQGLDEIEAKQSLNLLDLPNELIEKITLNLGVNDMENLGLTSKKAYALIYSEDASQALRFNKGMSLKEHYTHLENSLLVEAQYIRDNWQDKSSFHTIPEAFKHGSLLDAPFNLGKMIKINRLLDECNAWVIKSEIGLTKSSLQLSNMGLTRFPKSLLKDVTLAEYWGGLKALNLRSNQLAALPKKIGKLRNLKLLHLYNNKLTSLPVEIGNLQKLRGLLLSHNHLTAEALRSIPERFREDNWLVSTLETQTLLSEPSPEIPRSPRP